MTSVLVAALAGFSAGACIGALVLAAVVAARYIDEREAVE